MEQTDTLPPATSQCLTTTPSVPVGSNIIELPPHTEDIIDLFNRFWREWDSLPSSAWRGSQTPRFKALDELSFSELFRLSALWHRVRRPSAPIESDTNARHARRQERRWQNFYYHWAQPCLQERWANQYGLVQAGGNVSWKRLLGKTNIRDYWDARVDYPPWCDHTTLWRMPIKRGDNPHLAQVLVTQPYGYKLDEMSAFAAEKGLWFWISERPAWHFPGGAHFIEWAAPGSMFAQKRNTSVRHDLCHTMESCTPVH